MTPDSRNIDVVVSTGGRGGSSLREQIPIDKLAAEVQAFVGDLNHIIEKAASSMTGVAKLSEITVTASIEMGGKLSLLGSGIESKGSAGLEFKFTLP